MGRKSKYLSADEESSADTIKIWNVAKYIRLSQEDRRCRQSGKQQYNNAKNIIIAICG